MGTTITKEQNSSAAKAALKTYLQGLAMQVTSEVVAHSAGKKLIR